MHKTSQKSLAYFNEQHTFVYPAFRCSFSGLSRCRKKMLKMNNTQKFCLEHEMHTLIAQNNECAWF